MIEERLIESPRPRTAAPVEEEDDLEEEDEHEILRDHYGITINKRAPPTCPYNEKGEYVPRSKRR